MPRSPFLPLKTHPWSFQGSFLFCFLAGLSLSFTPSVVCRPSLLAEHPRVIYKSELPSQTWCGESVISDFFRVRGQTCDEGNCHYPGPRIASLSFSPAPVLRATAMESSDSLPQPLIHVR